MVKNFGNLLSQDCEQILKGADKDAASNVPNLMTGSKKSGRIVSHRMASLTCTS